MARPKKKDRVGMNFQIDRVIADILRKDYPNEMSNVANIALKFWSLNKKKIETIEEFEKATLMKCSSCKAEYALMAMVTREQCPNCGGLEFKLLKTPTVNVTIVTKKTETETVV